MKVYVAADHAGFTLKELVKAALLGQGYEVEDCGAATHDAHDDYPDFMSKAADKVAHNPFDRAVIIGGTGQGEAMVANKFPHVRAAVFYGTKEPRTSVDASGRESSDPYEIVRLARLHNDANVLSLGARFLTDDEALTAVRLFLTTAFSGEERHVRRLKKLEDREREAHGSY